MILTWRDADGVEHRLVSRSYLGGHYNPLCTNGYRLGGDDAGVYRLVETLKQAIADRRNEVVTCVWCAGHRSAILRMEDD